MSKEVVNKTEYNKLHTKVYYLENSIPDATTLFDTTQINKIWRKKNGNVDKNTCCQWFSDYYCS